MSKKKKTRNGHHGSNAEDEEIIRFSSESLFRIQQYDIDEKDKEELEQLNSKKDKRELEEA